MFGSWPAAAAASICARAWSLLACVMTGFTAAFGDFTMTTSLTVEERHHVKVWADSDCNVILLWPRCEHLSHRCRRSPPGRPPAAGPWSPPQPSSPGRSWSWGRWRPEAKLPARAEHRWTDNSGGTREEKLELKMWKCLIITGIRRLCAALTWRKWTWSSSLDSFSSSASLFFRSATSFWICSSSCSAWATAVFSWALISSRTSKRFSSRERISSVKMASLSSAADRAERYRESKSGFR